jgi:alkanesulfonate monooxygenase SsuD/methylene tetrahydromethanopterin reductase-like flavin-dependent oxidoreductase (luciferase family)
MKFALFNQLQMPKPWRENEEVLVYKEAIEEAVYAEAVGFDAYWQTEHHFYTEIGHSSAPEVVLAAISQRTSRLRLGLGVVVLPCNHPYRVAEYVSTLDVVSGGRVEFGTGRGASPYHVEAFGFSPSETKAVWEESLQAQAHPEAASAAVGGGHQSQHLCRRGSLGPRSPRPGALGFATARARRQGL